MSEPTIVQQMGDAVELDGVPGWRYRLLHWRPVRTQELFPDRFLSRMSAARWARGVGGRLTIPEKRRFMKLPRGRLIVTLPRGRSQR